MTDELNWPYNVKKCINDCGKEIYVLPNHVPICDECWEKRDK